MRRITLPGEVANPANPPAGCAFHPRCRYAVACCRSAAPAWTEAAPGRFVACHRATELELAGAPLIDLEPRRRAARP